MNLSRLRFICLLSLIIVTKSYSQVTEQPTVFRDSSIAYVEISGIGSSNARTPFWLQANKYGTVPNTSPSGSFRAQYEQFWGLNSYDESSPWRVGAGVEAVINRTDQTKLILPQAHASLRFKNWELFVGRKKQIIGLADSTIGMGSYAWSGNALPIPKIQIGTTQFVSVPFTNGWLSFNAFYSDGLFEKSRQVTKDLKFHQKALYLRIGNRKSRLKLYGGFNHQVQWGGKTPHQTLNGQMPTGFKNYIRAVTGKAYPVGPDLTEFDYNNRVGNHLGSIDLALEYQGFDYKWFFYRQNLYEDGSLYKFTNITDGLNGISVQKLNSYGADFEVTGAVIEFLYTKSQGGSTWILTQNLGRDNYFNHSQVVEGWSYFGRTIGTPFIPPTTDTYWKWPAFSYTSNNRVMVVHAGLKGTILQRVVWQTKLSYSSNSGTYDFPFESNPSQFSGLLSFQTNLRLFGGSTIFASFAGDTGQLYQNSYGFSLAFRKNFTL